MNRRPFSFTVGQWLVLATLFACVCLITATGGFLLGSDILGGDFRGFADAAPSDMPLETPTIITYPTLPPEWTPTPIRTPTAPGRSVLSTPQGTSDVSNETAEQRLHIAATALPDDRIQLTESNGSASVTLFFLGWWHRVNFGKIDVCVFIENVGNNTIHVNPLNLERSPLEFMGGIG